MKHFIYTWHVFTPRNGFPRYTVRLYQIVRNTPQAHAVQEAGGVLIGVRLSAPIGKNGGCGAPTYVAGTNGGQMPCGSTLKRADGSVHPYYCGLCDPSGVRSK